MDISQLLARFDDALMSQLFSSASLVRAKQYVGRVQDLGVSGNQIQAVVKGSEYEPYQVTVRLERKEFFGEATVEASTHCTCPVGHRCKHAAAVILAARRPGALVARPRAEVMAWAKNLRTQAISARKASQPKTARDAILHVFRWREATADIVTTLYKARLTGEGEISGQYSIWSNHEQALLKPPTFVVEADLVAFRHLRALERQGGYYGVTVLQGREGQAYLRAALETGRALLATDDSGRLIPLKPGPDRPAHLTWAAAEAGLRARLTYEPASALTARTVPLSYFDPATGEAGTLAVPNPEVVAEVLRLPVLTALELPVVAEALTEVAPELPPPTGFAEGDLEELDAPCRAVLELDSLRCWSWRKHRGYESSYGGHYGSGVPEYDIATAHFRYADASFSPGSAAALATLADGRTVRIRRNTAFEAQAMKALQEAGFQPLRSGWLQPLERLPEGALGLESEARWDTFFHSLAPRLREAGWDISHAVDFRHHLLVPDAWHADLEEGEEGWFDLSLGIEVDGRRMDLAPMLHAVFRHDSRWLERDSLDKLPDDMPVIVQIETGERVALTAGRIKPLARTLIDLFDRPGESLRVSRLDAPRLADVLGKDWRAQGLQALEAWVAKLRGLQAVAPVAPPAGLGITLREYQAAGLAWLQHLRAHDLGGILADDMGLGKTVQTLAHLLVEKQAGRLDRPALVVLPTSLVFNWQAEAARYTPDLRVLNLRGKERAGAFAAIPDHDVCLTTYPLLWRDREQLAAFDYHLLILDEAQTVKNAASQAAQVVRTLKARHRLCITGTPLENHLGELWAQFDFLLPGLLGDTKDFTSRWRTPIEKRGDALRRELLARRIAPFILRRRKEDVAKELPPKTVVIRSVELEGRQRDLYETVRATMDARVREEIAAKGFARSQIVILDALLKLRQVCCDPRLLKTEAAAKVKERAKLDLLMEMLPELVDEGRRVLLFSQFTGMLALIEDELKGRKLGYTLLTGDTEDRAGAIRRFQGGEVPIFLISLKAGGVGLNLTAADTVIHYDPWWNPAVENQATDRAHRLGQDKPVFVYKLVTAGSIEERIVGLQEKKAALAAGILSEDASVTAKFGEDDIRALLAPLPEIERETAAHKPDTRRRAGPARR